jgi:hypothetical protein
LRSVVAAYLALLQHRGLGRQATNKSKPKNGC